MGEKGGGGGGAGVMGRIVAAVKVDGATSSLTNLNELLWANQLREGSSGMVGGVRFFLGVFLV